MTRFGRVEDVLLHQQLDAPHRFETTCRVFVLFETAAEAVLALKNLHGRWFAGRQIMCELCNHNMIEWPKRRRSW